MRIDKRSAFTLIELLLAASISAVMLVGIYSAFQSGVMSYHKIEGAFAPYQSARNILNRMQSELRNTFAYALDDTGFQGQEKNLSFFTVLDTFEGGVEIRDFYWIKYTADEGVLERSAFAGQEAIKKDTGALGRKSLYKVKGISFQYACSRGGTDKGYDWLPSWPKDDSQKNTFPLAVKITLSLVAESGGQGSIEFTKIVGLPLS